MTTKAPGWGRVPGSYQSAWAAGGTLSRGTRAPEAERADVLYSGFGRRGWFVRRSTQYLSVEYGISSRSTFDSVSESFSSNSMGDQQVSPHAPWAMRTCAHHSTTLSRSSSRFTRYEQQSFHKRKVPGPVPTSATCYVLHRTRYTAPTTGRNGLVLLLYSRCG